jgi:hypothetical protein
MPSGYRFRPNIELADVICKLYVYGFSCESIARFVGCGQATIARFLDGVGVEKRPFGMIGRKHTQQVKDTIGDANRTGRNSHPTTDGYIMVYAPDHPYCNSNGYVREHRLVVEKRLGRYLRPEETVHHINEIRDDNRDENLELFESRESHSVIHTVGVNPSSETRAKLSASHKEAWARSTPEQRERRLKGIVNR